MQRTTYICDRCKVVFTRKQIVQVKMQKIFCDDTPVKICIDLCTKCHDVVKDAYIKALISDVDIKTNKNEELVKPVTKEEKCEDLTEKEDTIEPTEVDSQEDITEPDAQEELTKPDLQEDVTESVIQDDAKQAYEYKTGPMTSDEKLKMLKMFYEGHSEEEIAKALNRTVRGIRMSFNACKRNGELKEDTGMEAKEPELKEHFKEAKKVDVPGIMALANGGWSPRKMAGEHGLTVDEVLEILANERKKRSATK